jgi:hypothetical protein
MILNILKKDAETEPIPVLSVRHRRKQRGDAPKDITAMSSRRGGIYSRPC